MEFITAYRLQHSTTERWVNGQFVAFVSTTDNNGVRHKISASRGTSGLEVEADGKTSRVVQNVFPARAAVTTYYQSSTIKRFLED
jgi:hypothetical protein